MFCAMLYLMIHQASRFTSKRAWRGLQVYITNESHTLYSKLFRYVFFISKEAQATTKQHGHSAASVSDWNSLGTTVSERCLAIERCWRHVFFSVEPVAIYMPNCNTWTFFFPGNMWKTVGAIWPHRDFNKKHNSWHTTVRQRLPTTCWVLVYQRIWPRFHRRFSHLSRSLFFCEGIFGLSLWRRSQNTLIHEVRW